MITSHCLRGTLKRIGVRPSRQPQGRVFRAWCALAILAALLTASVQGAGTKLDVFSVSASADDGNGPANTLDGSLTTRWSASGDAQWILYDLGVSRPVGSVGIAWYRGNLRAARFEVRTSQDRSAWTPVFSGVSSGLTAGFETYDVVDSSARYVSIVCHGNSLDLWNSITELELYSPATATTLSWKLLSGPMFRLQWNCETGSVCQVQVSSNFVTWVDVSPPITSTTGTQTWADNVSVPPASVWPARYYRVKKLSTTPAAPTLTVVASDATAAEGGGNPGAFTISRTGSTAASLTVHYAIGGAAVNGTDFATLSGSVIIPAGSPVATLTVSPTDDATVEGNETVVLVLSADPAYLVGSPNSATVTITDNDQSPTQPTVTVVASDASASESGPNSGTFTFSRTGSTVAGLAVRYSIGGSAANATDYGTLSGSVTIPAGTSSAALTVNPIEDTVVEGSETVVLTLSADAAYLIGSPSSATVTIADNDSGGTTLPSNLLNLTDWKLTLPVDTSRAGSPDEVRQPELASFMDPDYFYVNSTQNGVVFTAHCGGATTSNSGYPRSELREMTSSGTANASWSTTSGTHTMEIRQAVTHLPVVKPHVVVGQIHDAGDDVIVFRLEGSKLFVDQNGVNGPVLTSNYQLGTVFTVKFVARNGGVEAYYNGQYIYTYPVSTSGCYFKAGCYTQSNTSRGDEPSAYGQVVIYGLTVTHQ
jgi:hypothetical protein